MPDWFVTEDPGILTDNYEIVSSFRRAYSNGAGDREQLSGWYLELRRTGAWRKWLEPGNVKRSRAKAIREFLFAGWLRGRSQGDGNLASGNASILSVHERHPSGIGWGE